MITDAETLWNKTLEGLTAALSEVTTMQYFGGSRGLSLEGNTLRVELPEDKDGDLLRQQFGYFIDKALAAAEGPEGLSVRFERVAPKVHPTKSALTDETSAHQETRSSGTQSTGLQERFTFDTFVRGPSNDFPMTMAQYVAKNPGDEANRTNPLFMYGPPGVGKTHLMHAIGNMAVGLNPNLSVLYTTSENLMNDYVRSWTSDDRKEAFREKYRTPDILLVDDIQYISGKKGLQEEIFNIFNALTAAHCQIVMTSDRAPNDIPDVMDRLADRFQSGICADVDIPAYETRLNILMLKLRSYPDVSLSREVLDFIAQRVSSSVRALEGALSCTVNYARMFPGNAASAVTVEVLERSILKNFIQQEESIVRLTCADIQKVVCTHCDVRLEDLCGSGRTRDIAIPRQIAMFLCRKLTSSSLPDIGRAFKRQHSTVLYSCGTVQDLFKAGDPQTVATLKSLVAALGRSLSDLN